ncbi:hypothetical protein CAEBREN_04581 [Caenorhabditis brenneri]|uniref:Uncharacterized protein n=1 Tax=Caenorhabditis brenneri TaxID=135651 RepID=G0NIW7_CAEBE|nr:hypothetical protein CAEBREN_04581 [Caenorhabditis brenneri]
MCRMRNILLIFSIHLIGLSKTSNEFKAGPLAIQDSTPGSNETSPPPGLLSLQNFFFPGFNGEFTFPKTKNINKCLFFQRPTTSPATFCSMWNPNGSVGVQVRYLKFSLLF